MSCWNAGPKRQKKDSMVYSTCLMHPWFKKDTLLDMGYSIKEVPECHATGGNACNSIVWSKKKVAVKDCLTVTISGNYLKPQICPRPKVDI